MKVLVLGDVNSIHLKKWCNALQSNGIELAIFSLNRPSAGEAETGNAQVFHPSVAAKSHLAGSLWDKRHYLKTLPELRRVIKTFKPDILHAHYASSYGTLGALCGFHPFILSAWGSDIFDFPNRSRVARSLLRFNLRNADRILSTSNVMSQEIRRYTKKTVDITPFGIDSGVFQPNEVTSLFPAGSFVIGTIKALEPEYGIATLIDAFILLLQKHPGKKLKLLIAGGGSLEAPLKLQVKEAGMEKDVIFTGKIPHQQVPMYLNMLDVFAALSVSESFGVSVIEASSCELPVVVSSVGGLAEVVEKNVTGMIIPPGNSTMAADCFESLLLDPAMGKQMGRNGRNLVQSRYEWNHCVDLMLDIYNRVMETVPKKMDKKYWVC